MQPYGDRFYDEIGEHARRSARRIVPLVLDLAPVRSVIDVGCGRGTWLATFAELGVDDLFGIDGAHVRPETLEIAPERFRAVALEEPFAMPRRFDLAVSLEVAEHLPPSSADHFVDSLRALAPLVLFSAAVPSQGGVHHVNEQWQPYWAERFARGGYRCVDCIRAAVWADPEVSWWYAQNTFLYASEEALAAQPRLAERVLDGPPAAFAHPALVEANHARMRQLRALLALAAAVPDGEQVLVVDDGCLLEHRAAVRHFRWLPFLERDGRYWGAAPDDATALAELERMRRQGATRIAFVWPALWWLDTFAGFARHLAAKHERVIDSPDLVVYELRP